MTPSIPHDAVAAAAHSRLVPLSILSFRRGGGLERRRLAAVDEEKRSLADTGLAIARPVPSSFSSSAVLVSDVQ